MRSFQDGDDITIEPFRAEAFPVVKDLMVDRSAFDRIIASGGFISAATGGAQRRQRPPRPQGERRPGHGRGGLHRLRRLRGRLPQRLGHAVRRGQGRPSWRCCRRASPSAWTGCASMVAQMDAEGFGNCTNHGECEAVCPKGINLGNIARLNRDYLHASLSWGRRPPGAGGGGPG